MAHSGVRNRVLVVDDDWLMRWSLSETLSEHGCQVVEATDATSAYAALAADPDVVLLDLHLPDSQSLDLLSSIHRRTPLSNIVLMSAYLTPDIDREARDRGAFEVMPKPFEMTDLLDVVDRAEGRHH
jgi:two-component system, NtrC family, nitrogen regulation response regulator GlnG